MSQVPAAANVLSVLRWLAAQAAPAPAAAIARGTGLPRSTTYHLLAELARQGFVVHLAEERRYGLGVAAYELGHGWSRQAPLERLARAPLHRLVTATGHTGHLAVLHGNEVVYVIEDRAPRRAPLVSDVGVRLPAHLTATGRAVLAALPAAHVRALFPDGDFVTRHGAGPTTLSALRALLVAVRAQGWAEEDGEVTPGFASVAAPVLDAADHPVAAVALTFPAAEVDPAARSVLAREVVGTAGEVQRRTRGEAVVGAVVSAGRRR
ncbi:IclR family transcriptional regulator [Aquipuribacter nitratireducens]|uniref:IclR family transcriptional regulator n=1 Tax=Aquipuribacter nitratireducens TaxID=650104 RepID=A0ABW0GLB3_9MICO